MMEQLESRSREDRAWMSQQLIKQQQQQQQSNNDEITQVMQEFMKLQQQKTNKDIQEFGNHLLNHMISYTNKK